MHCFVRSYELLEQFPFCGAQAKHFLLPFGLFSLSAMFVFDVGTQNYVTGMSRDVLGALWSGHIFRLTTHTLKVKKKQVFRNFKHFKSLQSFFIHIELQKPEKTISCHILFKF